MDEAPVIADHWHLSERQIDQLSDYAQLLITVAKTLGLIGFGDGQVWHHIARSLLLTEHIAAPPPASRAAPPRLIMDVGSGAGLPGVPLAIASGEPMVLVEPRQRAVSFLEKAVRDLNLDCSVLPVRAEQAAAEGYGESADRVVARSLAAPAEAARICSPLLKPGGTLVLTAAPGEGARLELGTLRSELGLGQPVSVASTGPLDITQRVHIIPKIRSISNRAPT